MSPSLMTPLRQIMILSMCLLAPRTHADEMQAMKEELRAHLTDIRQQFPFDAWTDQLSSGKQSYNRLNQQSSRPDWASDKGMVREFQVLEQEMQRLKQMEPQVRILSEKLRAESIGRDVAHRLAQKGQPISEATQQRFIASLKPYEEGSLKEKKDFVLRLRMLQNWFEELKLNWQFAYATNFLTDRVNQLLRAHKFAQQEADIDRLKLKLTSALQLADYNPSRAETEMREVKKEFLHEKPGLMSTLSNLLEVLHTDMLFSDLLAQASQDGVEFTLQVEEKIEASLKMRSSQHLVPLQAAVTEVEQFESRLTQAGGDLVAQVEKLKEKERLERQRLERERLAREEEERRLREVESARRKAEEERHRQAEMAEAREKQHQQLALERQRREEERKQLEEEQRRKREELARAEERRIEEERRRREELEKQREEARLAAIRAEEERLAREREERMARTLTMLTDFSFKNEVDLDENSKKALQQKSGFLKSSHVGSARKKLKVDKAQMDRSMYHVDTLIIEAHNQKINALNTGERDSYSAYAYRSPGGRTTQKDLEDFVREICLGSFDNKTNFISYKPPTHWRPGRVSWSRDTQFQKDQNHDREFSYVEMVVDAHRVRKNGAPQKDLPSVNIPANMLLIFDPRGALVRYQSFSDINQVHIQPSDLVNGKLYYKFLNYSVDRQYIYLNGIDREMKSSSPS